jgi:2,3,4,5-tetrahydropyridine-2-carboxylate N-succinyltransferase
MSDSSRRMAYGMGLFTMHMASGDILDVWFPEPRLGLPADEAGPEGIDELRADEVDPARDTTRQIVQVAIDLDAEPEDTADVWLRLHLLSHRLVRPNDLNMTGVFGKLTNVVWTNHGPCAADGFEGTRAKLMRRGPVHVYGVDKFPRMVDYVLPSGVRIADGSRVRLGAYLSPGTTVMHEGFVNYNAGTLGTSMVEGRITAGVVVGDGSDIGGGASILGTLSGGGKEVITIGERCLIGANGGIGISLGDDCVVEAGCYVTAGTKVTLPDGMVVRARELSGRDNMMLWRNSVTGRVEAVARSGSWGALNADLHAND